MEYFNLDKDIARLILLQRIELASPLFKKIRKLFGRYIFTNFITKFMISSDSIGNKYYSSMLEEYNLLKNFISFKNKKILSIGAGMCGLELIIDSKSENNFFYIIEKDYISKKVKYGWDEKNDEGYNKIDLLELFLLKNDMKKEKFKIFNFDKDILPIKKFDLIISLYSLDYHYSFSFYIEYLKKVMGENTQIIFDTIRPDYFKKIFKTVKIISRDEKAIHSSKRIICNQFIV